MILDNKTVFEKAKRLDVWATRVIRAGGLVVVLAVITMLFLIVKVALPLLYSPKAELVSKFSPPLSSPVLAVGLDEWLENAFSFDTSGKVSFWDIAQKIKRKETPLVPLFSASQVQSIKTLGSNQVALLWNDGSVTVEAVRFIPEFDSQGKKNLAISVERRCAFSAVSKVLPLDYVVSISEEGNSIATFLGSNGQLTVHWQNSTQDFLGNEKIEESHSEIKENFQEEILCLAQSREGHLFAGTRQGTLWHWNLEKPGNPIFIERTIVSNTAVSCLNFVLGENSIAVGDASGKVNVWASVFSPLEKKHFLTLLHPLTQQKSSVLTLFPSERTRSIVSIDEKGEARLSHVTTERSLFSFKTESPLIHAALSARDNGMFAMNRAGEFLTWKLSMPHSEITFKTLFSKIWYEGYSAPEYTWQSSASTDEFEPKFSLIPLIFGSMKGTAYAMLFAVPMALMGAIYVSQFASLRVKKIVKPTLEIMAAVPSVVIGFLAALWFAPILEHSLVSFFLCFVLFPLFFLTFLLLWPTLSKHPWIKKYCKGTEWIWVIPLLLFSFVMAYQWGFWIEEHYFSGNAQQWIFEHWGERYEHRNSIIIAFALGFTVIPIVFTISEDALSNVPGSLKAASYALGASRWQTVWRVILLSSSPGIFAGIMIGVGRAVGETMIVLMATGNTPIMDGSPFNGMRTLAANIAVEILEAPVDGTLYRVLFLSAVILFLLTFTFNTAAELIRQKLRKKYAKF
jgi:phosphate transport system permease protein